MPTCIALENVTKYYGRHAAVRDLSFSVQTGEVFGLLGPNGAGKSTTLYMLCGLLRPTRGRISIFGRELHANFISIAQRMGVLCERPAGFEYLTLRRNLQCQVHLAGRSANVERTLDLVGLHHLADETVRRLSVGLRQRFGLAQALLTEPELLILDEPCSGLDPEAAQETLGLLRRLADEARVTIVFSSHRLDEVEHLCDRVLILNEGALVVAAETDDLVSYDSERVEVLLEGAEGAAKRLAGQPWVEGVETRNGRLFVRLGDATVHQLNLFLVNNGYQVAGLLPRRRTLQDYFLKVLQQ